MKIFAWIIAVPALLVMLVGAIITFFGLAVLWGFQSPVGRLFRYIERK